MKVFFDASLPTNAGGSDRWVYRRGKIFEAGDYPDKNLSVSPAELRLAAEVFRPVAANLEHESTILDGNLGGLVDVSVSEDGTVLYGVIAEPRWLAQEATTEERKVSIEWNREQKNITGIAYTLNPRVKDAQVFAAFSRFAAAHPETVHFRFETPQERDAIDNQDFADPKNQLLPVRNQMELRDAQREVWNADDPVGAMKRMMDIAARKGLDMTRQHYSGTPSAGISRGLEDANSYSPWGSYYSNGAQAAGGDAMDKIQLDAALTKQRQEMTGRISAYFGVDSEQARQILEIADSEKTPRELELERQLASVQAAQFSSAAGARVAEAKARATALAKDGRIQPALIDAVAAEFSRAMEDDAANPKAVTFSDAEGKAVECSRAQRLELLYGGQPAIRDTEERVREFAPETMAVFSQEATRLRNADETTIDHSFVESVASELPNAKAMSETGKLRGIKKS